MKSRSLLCLLAATLSTGLLSKAALADTLTLTTVTAAAGGAAVAVYGTYSNTSSVLEYLNGDSFTVNATGVTLDDTPFDNGVYTLASGVSFTEELFTLTAASGTAASTDTGSYTIYGGPNTGSDNMLATSTLTVNVTNAAAVTPEPSTWLLLGTGLLGMGFLLRRRDALAVAAPLA